jgi:hypothetical protein
MRPETYHVETMKQIIREMTIELMDYGGTTPGATCEAVAEDHPKLYAAVGADRTLALCREIHESSDPVESARLQELFVKFNAQYFSGQLDGFIVLAVYDAGGVPSALSSGRVDFLNRQIHIALTEYRDWMPEMLLHHMAHASTLTRHDTEEEWIAEMRRLRELGAPVDTETSSQGEQGT